MGTLFCIFTPISTVTLNILLNGSVLQLAVIIYAHPAKLPASVAGKQEEDGGDEGVTV